MAALKEMERGWAGGEEVKEVREKRAGEMRKEMVLGLMAE